MINKLPQVKSLEKTDGGFIININKPPGWSSFDVVKKIRVISGIKKVGHAGTLDPFATGVLLICLDKATKKVPQLQNLPKTYEATLLLGIATDTLDNTGTVIKEKQIPEFNKTELRQILNKFIGSIHQRIPDYSASKIAGRRSYSLARKGKKVPERFKQVDIFQLKLLSRTTREIHFRVVCGQGTFVRTLGSDIAEKIGTVGHLTALIRKSIGDYRIENAILPTEFSEVWHSVLENENI